jgi:hypothetical protein
MSDIIVSIRFLSPYVAETLYTNIVQPGDIVAVNVQSAGRREGLVIGQHIDYAVCPSPPNSSHLP